MFTSFKEQTHTKPCKEFIFVAAAVSTSNSWCLDVSKGSRQVLGGNSGCSQLSQDTEWRSKYILPLN